MPMSTSTLIQKQIADDITAREKTFYAWISTDEIDHEGDVVIPDGVNTSICLTNPAVLAFHDMTRWPLGTCASIRPARKGGQSPVNGLFAKTIVDEDEDALKVFGMIQR